MRDDKQMAALAKRFAETATLEWFDNTIAALDRGAREMRNYRKRFVAVTAGSKGVADLTTFDVLGWAVYEFQNVTRNVRLDMLPKHGADLAVADLLVKNSEIAETPGQG